MQEKDEEASGIQDLARSARFMMVLWARSDYFLGCFFFVYLALLRS